MLLLIFDPMLSTRDPLDMVHGLGRRAARSRSAAGLGAALALHLAASACAAGSLGDMRDVAQAMRAAVQEQLRLTYDVELPPPPQEEPEVEEPEPEPEPLATPPKPPPDPKDDPYDTPPPPEDPYDLPPAPAQAPSVLTTDEVSPTPDPAAFVTGTGEGPGYGRVSAQGTARRATYRSTAAVGGVPGGRGREVRPMKDLSRPPALLGDSSWDCPFPVEADASGSRGGLVSLVINVRADGIAQSVRVVADPGQGFGREARNCAMRHRYRPARDRAGTPIAATLGPIRVRFIR